MPRKTHRFGISDNFPVNRHNAALELFYELVYKPILQRYLNRIVGINNGTVSYRVVEIDFQEPLNESLFHLQRLDTGKFINPVLYENITKVRRDNTIPPKDNKKQRSHFGWEDKSIDEKREDIIDMYLHEHVSVDGLVNRYFVDSLIFNNEIKYNPSGIYQDTIAVISRTGPGGRKIVMRVKIGKLTKVP